MKSKVTLFVRRDFILKGKEMSKQSRTSLSADMRKDLETRVKDDNKRFSEIITGLTNLIPEQKKISGNIDWKKELLDSLD